MRLVLTTNNEIGFCEFTEISSSVNPIEDREKGLSLTKHLIGDKDKIWGCWDLDVSSDREEIKEEIIRLCQMIPYSETIFNRFNNKIRCDLKNRVGTWGVKGVIVSEMMRDYPKIISEVK